MPITGYKQKSSFIAGSSNDVAKIVNSIKDEEELEHKKMSEIASIQSSNKAWAPSNIKEETAPS